MQVVKVYFQKDNIVTLGNLPRLLTKQTQKT